MLQWRSWIGYFKNNIRTCMVALTNIKEENRAGTVYLFHPFILAIKQIGRASCRERV